MHRLLIKRIYEDANSQDGYRILVDRLWPRGKSKDQAQVHLWAKELAPSNELRKAFDHDPSKMEFFRTTFRQELEQNPAAPRLLNLIQENMKKGNVTLLYSARSEVYNQAAVLRDWLTEKIQE